MSTNDKLVEREEYERPSPSPAEQAREGGVLLDRADPREAVRRGLNRPTEGAKYRRLMGDFEY